MRKISSSSILSHESRHYCLLCGRVKGLRKPYALVSEINQKSLQSIERLSERAKFPPTAITCSLLLHSRVKKD